MPEKFQIKYKKLVAEARGGVVAYYQLVMMEKKDGKAAPRPQEKKQKDTAAIAVKIKGVMTRWFLPFLFPAKPDIKKAGLFSPAFSALVYSFNLLAYSAAFAAFLS